MEEAAGTGSLETIVAAGGCTLICAIGVKTKKSRVLIRVRDVKSCFSLHQLKWVFSDRDRESEERR